MASSVQSIGDRHPPFEADATERVHTIKGRPGGRVNNIGLVACGGAIVYLNPDGGTVTTGDGGSIPLEPGAFYDLDPTCKSYSLKTASGNAYIVHQKL